MWDSPGLLISAAMQVGLAIIIPKFPNTRVDPQPSRNRPYGMGYTGLIVIDKPAGVTSHDVVARVRRLVGEKSCGHLGTLDPMATGVLPLVLGRFTRISQFYGDSPKSYEGEIRLGFATDTYDADGEPITPQVSLECLLVPHNRPPLADVGMSPATNANLVAIQSAAAAFLGDIQQLPPAYSAKKIAGVPAYKLARRDQPVELKPVSVTVHQFDITSLEADRARFHARVSSGTYIRSLAHELGQRLGCGAHLSALRRTQVAEFAPEDLRTFDELEAALASGTLDSITIHPRRILPDMPCVSATEENVAWIRNGRAVNLPEMSSAPLVKVFHGQRDLICIAQRIAGTLFHPKVVLMPTPEPARV
jgi:tRNA pseudouridine55 synthase